ncbi:MAG TPA: GAF domain-containing protein [Anaerolineaceae bacterium]|nr:GAF domain-containing protein [Anaerolineaceae bacterium]
MNIRLRITLTLIAVGLVPIILVFLLFLGTVTQMRNRALLDSRTALEQAGEQSIRDKAEAVAQSVSLYISLNPDLDPKDYQTLETDEALIALAVQPVGNTGYTAIHDSQGINHFHSNPALVGTYLGDLAERLPEFWALLEKSLDGSVTEGYYDWLEPDGVTIRQKYMVLVPIEGTDLRVAATTYIDEFSSPVQLLINNLSGIITRSFLITTLLSLGIAGLAVMIAVFFGRRFTAPIGALTNSAEQMLHGNLNVRANIQSKDEFGVLANTFNSMAAQLSESIVTLEQRVQERTQGLELAAEVGRSVSRVRDLDSMLREAVELIRSRFNLYYVQIYLTDTIKSNLVLKSGTGSVGAELLSRNHRLPLLTSSINGRAAVEKKSIVVADTAASMTFRPNPLLPDTRSEMSIPLIVGDQVVGVLDMQSSEPNALNSENLTAYEALAGQLAIAIQNASSLAETRQARAEVEAQARRLARANWVEYLDAINAPETFGYVFDGYEMAPLTDIGTPSSEEDGTIVAPISVTGEPLGNLVVEISGQSTVARTRELVNSVARQVAQQIENLRLLESAERARAEAEKVSRRMTGEGWKEFLDTTGRDSLGFLYNLSEVRPVAFDNDQLAQETGITLPLKVRDEPVGTLMVQGLEATDNESLSLINVVAERLGAHIESLRQQAQTKSALEQTENLSAAGLRLAQAGDLQEMLRIIHETLGIPVINRQLLGVFNYNAANELVDMEIAANWWSGMGPEPTEVGHRYTLEEINTQAFTMPEPLFSNDAQNDPRVIEGAHQVVTQQNIRAMASMPLFIGGRQIGVLLLEGQEPYKFSPADTRLFIAMAPQIATVLENRRQFERAQKQAERQSTLNLISQKIQSATSVEAVLQIAARELGHALGAPRTIAQLSIKDKE